MIKDVKVGQEIWFEHVYTAVNSGIVTEVSGNSAEDYVMVNGTRDTIGTMGAKLKNCYPTKKALLEGLRKNSEKQVKEYCESIKTTEDLVVFCYNKTGLAEEYTDWDARKAAQIRAKQLLNIDLE